MPQMISVEEDLPTAEDLDGDSADLYLVEIEGFGPQIAMYLIAPSGECGWYKDYVSKIIRPVTHWSVIE
jgi:hypothetical protein